MITVTDKAAEHLRNISEANDGKFPKLAVKGGGCAGFSYDWSLVSKDQIDDMSDEVIALPDGGNMVVDGMSVMYLFGTQLELNTSLFGTTLEIVNPSAQSSCGCGESINFDMDAVAENYDKFNLPE